MRFLHAIPALAALAACGEFVPANLYLLPPAPSAAKLAQGFEQQLIVLPRVTLPSYAADNRIATVVDGLLIEQQSANLWADDPERATTVRLAAALSERTGAPVLAEPWPIEAAPSFKIDVLVAGFVGPPGGPVALTGEFRVSDQRLNGLAIVRSFAIEAEAPGEGVPGLVAAHSAAIGRLADEIAAALFERFGRPAS